MDSHRLPPSLSPSPFGLWLDRILDSASRPPSPGAASDPVRAAGLEMVRKMLEGGRRP